jgi:hypothetical protein
MNIETQLASARTRPPQMTHLRRKSRAWMRGLGTGDQVAGEITSTAGAAGGITSTIAAIVAPASAAGPIGLAIAGGAALVGLILNFVGKGCGSACTESATQEQVYEAAGDIVYHAAVMGMLTPAQALAGLQAILQAGQQAMTALESSDKKAAAGLTNMNSSIGALISDASSLAAVAPVAYNWGTLASAWLAMTTPSGWEPGALSAGEQLAEQIMQSLTSETSAIAGSVTSAAAGLVEGAASGSFSSILILAVAAYLGVKLLEVIF